MRCCSTMTGKWMTLAVFGVFALLALTDADFHQEDSKFTLTPEEQEEITRDWTVQDVDKRKGGRVIRAGVAIKLKGRRPKLEDEEIQKAVDKKPRIIVADVLVRLKKRRRAPQEELDYDEEVALLSQLANGIVADPRDSRQADKVTDESRDCIQDDLIQELL